MPERLRPLLTTLAVLALVGCGQAAPDVAPSSVSPTVGPTSAVPTSPSPAPSRTSASPSPTLTPSASASPASAKDGTYANELSLSEDGALSFVPLRWYTGANAEAGCREKGIEPELAWCSDYYYEKAGKRQAAALTGQTKVRLLNEDLKQVDGTLTQLVEAIEAEVWPNFQIAVTDGKVTRISQVFTP